MTTNVQARARVAGKSTTIAPAVVLLAGWLVPGLGHLLLKKWIRASLIFVSILSMFLIGLALKGKVYSPNTAELLDMHPQTLRMYEARGLIEPKRSPKGTRLYSHKDVERLRKIQAMTAELGMNLAGVERVFELEEKLEAMARKVAVLERRAGELKAEVERLEEIRRELRAEIVPYEQGGALIRTADLKTFTIPIERGN